MKDVSLFLLKKVFKSRLNWIILVLLVSALGITFYFNSRTANSVSLELGWKLILQPTRELSMKMKRSSPKCLTPARRNTSLLKKI